jgi:hypothetical protein
MSWPEPIGSLLARPETRAGQALRWGLHGLRAALQAALDEVPPDPGGEDLRALLAELGTLLAQSQAPAGQVLPVDAPAERLPGDGAEQPRLLPLAQAVAADSRLLQEGRRGPGSADSDDEIWNDVQRLLLRVPPPLAEEWRRRCLQLAEEAGGRPDEASGTALPLTPDEVIYPGLTGAVRAAGLRSSAAARLDPRLPAPEDSDLRELAGIASACLWFIEHDPHLCHCLRNVFRFGLAPLAGEQRERYVAELLRRWERVRTGAGGQGFRESLRARLDLDEALHSLVHQPPAAAGSWWGRLQRRARATLFAARDQAARSGFPVHLQELGGSFAEINRLAPDSLQVDFGVPGEVCACLRVWARVDGEELKGRVLYRSPQESS